MKKGLVFVTLLLFLVSFGFVLAIPAPWTSYCQEMGYTQNATHCIFDDENSCEIIAFYEGTCGEEYVVNVTCAKEGETIGAVIECCEGLETIPLTSPGTVEGVCATRTGYATCSNCGDGICKEWENICNCPKDCNKTIEKTCENFPGPEFCEGGIGQIIVTGHDENNCAIYACKKTENKTEIEIEINGKKIKIQEKFKHIIKVKNRLRAIAAAGECPEKCVCSGSTVKCEFQNGSRIMTIHAGNSGNTIVQVKGINASTKVELFKEGEKVYGVFKNDETKEIILPDKIKEKIKGRIKARMENSSLELDEEGQYRYEAKKQARLFWMFKVKEKVSMNINAETGEIERVRTSWWGWLARDIKEEVEENVEITEIDETS